MSYRKQLMVMAKNALNEGKFQKLTQLNISIENALERFPGLPMAHPGSREALMEAANTLLDNRGSSKLSYGYLCNALYAVSTFVEDDNLSDACIQLEAEIDTALDANGNTFITLDTVVFPDRDGFEAVILDDDRSINTDLTSYALVLVRLTWIDKLLNQL